MRQTKEKQIGSRGFTYHVTQFGAREGSRVLVRLLKLIGGAAGEAIKTEGEGVTMQTIGKIVASLSESVSEEAFDDLCVTFAKASAVSGGEFRAPVPLNAEGVFDLHFAGAYAELGQWLLFAIEANFGSFLAESGIVRRVKEAASARPASEAPPEPAPSQ